jgi:hypothetical protein
MGEEMLRNEIVSVARDINPRIARIEKRVHP